MAIDFYGIPAPVGIVFEKRIEGDVAKEELTELGTPVSERYITRLEVQEAIKETADKEVTEALMGLLDQFPDAQEFYLSWE